MRKSEPAVFFTLLVFSHWKYCKVQFWRQTLIYVSFLQLWMIMNKVLTAAVPNDSWEGQVIRMEGEEGGGLARSNFHQHRSRGSSLIKDSLSTNNLHDFSQQTSHCECPSYSYNCLALDSRPPIHESKSKIQWDKQAYLPCPAMCLLVGYQRVCRWATKPKLKLNLGPWGTPELQATWILSPI